MRVLVEIGRLMVFAAVAIALLIATAHARPNIVVIMTDDQDDIGSIEKMPKLNKLLVSQGLRFTNSFVDYPSCGPSRASFLTGLARHNHQVLTNSPRRGVAGWPKFHPLESNTLPVWLERAGYRTAFIGKYVNSYGKGHYPSRFVPPGWDSWWAVAGRVQSYDYTVNVNSELKHFGTASADYLTDQIADQAEAVIEEFRAGQDPFFIWIAPKAPHPESGRPPIPAPRHQAVDVSGEQVPRTPDFNESDVSDKPPHVRVKPLIDPRGIAKLDKLWRERLKAMLAIDDLVQRVVVALGTDLDDTVIIFTSDNGFMLGEHRLTKKLQTYDASLRVPLIIRGPGIPAAAKSTRLVTNLDLTATIVDLAGATADRDLDGRSFVPLIASPTAPWRSAIPLSGRIGGVAGVGVRTKTHKYVSHSGSEELYDLVKDPFELENQVANAGQTSDPAYQDDLVELRDLTDRLKTCSGESCWVQ